MANSARVIVAAALLALIAHEPASASCKDSYTCRTDSIFRPSTPSLSNSQRREVDYEMERRRREYEERERIRRDYAPANRRRY
jgi:hypothetical protein